MYKTTNSLDINLPKGKYIVAVSGGVDSMVLLDVLAKQKDINLIVAHFDHGIRTTSGQDMEVVKEVAHNHKLPFVTKKANLGPNASEETAREARYQFLISEMEKMGADSIVTAHHQNDLVETAVFNMLRGTGRKGLTSLKSTDIVKRPLLKVTKKQIKDYAKANGLIWSEDETNSDLKYKRNYIRHNLLTRFDEPSERKFSNTLTKAAKTNTLLDKELEAFIAKNSDTEGQLNRYAFTMLPHKLALEVMATWLRNNGIRDFDSKLLDKLVVGAKTLQIGKKIDVNTAHVLHINRDDLALTAREC